MTAIQLVFLKGKAMNRKQFNRAMTQAINQIAQDAIVETQFLRESEDDLRRSLTMLRLWAHADAKLRSSQDVHRSSAHRPFLANINKVTS